MQLQLTPQEIERFWSKVDRNGPVIRPELGPCWIWTGHPFPNGYGCFSTNRPNRHHLLAHRVAYALTHGGELPEGILRHRCDNRPCCRPDHTLPGTQAENIRDMIERGRMAPSEQHRPKNPAHGARHYRAQLTESQVTEIRERYAAGGIGQAELGKLYGIGQGAVRKIVHGTNWKHLPVIPVVTHPGHTIHQPRGKAHGMAKLSEDQVRQIRAAVGVQSKIADQFGISQTTVWRIRSGKGWHGLT